MSASLKFCYNWCKLLAVFGLLVLQFMLKLVFHVLFLQMEYYLVCVFSTDHGSPDPWGHSGQLGPGSYSGSAGSYSNSYSMHPRDGMVSQSTALRFVIFAFVFFVFVFVYLFVCF